MGALSEALGFDASLGPDDVIMERQSALRSVVSGSVAFFSVILIVSRVCTKATYALGDSKKILPIAHVVPSTVHAVVVGALSIYTALSDKSLNFTGELWSVVSGEGPVDFVQGHSDTLLFTVGITVGYFIVDMVIMLMDNELTVAFFIHHVLGSIFFAAGVILDDCEAFIAYLLTTELSTPFLNIMLVSKEGSSSKSLGAAIFALMFLIVRFLPIPLYLFAMYQTQDFYETNGKPPYLKYLSNFAILIPPVLNGIWGVEVIRRMIDALSPPKKTKKVE
ncbi:hypothetical protein AAMO2058_001527200 [Amorphochlora amoebiformis]